MTNERKNSDPDNAIDERVAGVYRELATERTPEHLDTAILQRAAIDSRPAYKRSIIWTRPVAWVAVVAICLAITLQVTQVPVPNEVPGLDALQRDDRAPAVDKDTATAVESESPAKVGQKQAPPPAMQKESLASDTPATELDEDVAASRSYGFRQEPQPATSVDARREEASAAPPEDFAMPDAELLRRAEEMRRQRSGDTQQAEPAALGVTAMAPASASADMVVASCSNDDRQDPEKWLLCIVLLEKDGHLEEATLERDLLARSFPDFKPPAKTE